MDSLPTETHQEILLRARTHVQQVLRLTNKYFYSLIKPTRVRFLEFGIIHGLPKYCEIGLKRGEVCGNVCLLAIEHGQLEVLRWALSQGYPWSWDCGMHAILGGHLEILKWAHSQGRILNKSICKYAAVNNHLEILQWARSQNCPWDEWICIHAAANNHLEVLQWAHENGCPWNPTEYQIPHYSPRIQEYAKSLRG